MRILDILRVYFFFLFNSQFERWKRKTDLMFCVRFVFGYIFNLITLFWNPANNKNLNVKPVWFLQQPKKKKKSTRPQQTKKNLKKYEIYWSDFVHFWFLFRLDSQSFSLSYRFFRTFCIMVCFFLFRNEIAWEPNQVPHF